MSTPLLDLIFERGEVSRSVDVGATLRKDGMKAVLDRTAEEFKKKLIGRVEGFPVGHRFTIDRVVDEIGGRPAGVHPCAIGALTFYLAKHGVMEKTGEMFQAERATSRKRGMPEWIRL